MTSHDTLPIGVYAGTDASTDVDGVTDASQGHSGPDYSITLGVMRRRTTV